MTVDRAQFATSFEGDVDYLRRCFDEGHEITKGDATSAHGIPERRFRAAIAQLRADGYPVVSWSEQGSVYRKASDVAEMSRFIDTELVPRIRKLEREARAMRTNGPTYYRVHQPALIGLFDQVGAVRTPSTNGHRSGGEPNGTRVAAGSNGHHPK